MNGTIITAEVVKWCQDYDGPLFHACLTDPPYHLHSGSGKGGFMNAAWDGGGVAFHPETWAALASVLHPGGFGMAFASSRGWHRLAVAIEDAGLVIHPSVFGWTYGSGFPKATRIDTAIDRAAGAERGVVGPNPTWREAKRNNAIMEPVRGGGAKTITAPATPLAAAWAGHRYGLQALKPALEPIIVFQRPYAGRPVDSITATGAGALWIDGGRVPTGGDASGSWGSGRRPGGFGNIGAARGDGKPNGERHPAGRWPANFYLQHTPACQPAGTRRVKGTSPIGSRGEGGQNGRYGPIGAQAGHDFTDADGLETVAAWDCADGCPVAALGAQSGERATGGGNKRNTTPNAFRARIQHRDEHPDYSADTGTAARFFHNPDWSLDVAEALAAADPVRYVAKASRAERNAGLPHGERSNHPTVKPLALARHLATLLLPPDAYAPRRLFVPFAGSGSEMIGARLAGWEEVVGVELSDEYAEIARARLAWWEANAPDDAARQPALPMGATP